MIGEETKNRFGGIARLYGVCALESFVAARMVVFGVGGVGGVGSWTVEGLAPSRIGCIRMVDLDEICTTNVNRQLHAMNAKIGRQNPPISPPSDPTQWLFQKLRGRRASG
jgi:tRNA threonylcarbamoyladenosine dehydratase